MGLPFGPNGRSVRPPAPDDVLGIDNEPAPGDKIAIHRGRACERLDARQLATLQAWTGRELAIANR